VILGEHALYSTHDHNECVGGFSVFRFDTNSRAQEEESVLGRLAHPVLCSLFPVT